jgi:hypothetical protein
MLWSLGGPYDELEAFESFVAPIVSVIEAVHFETHDTLTILEFEFFPVAPVVVQVCRLFCLVLSYKNGLCDPIATIFADPQLDLRDSLR